MGVTIPLFPVGSALFKKKKSQILKEFLYIFILDGFIIVGLLLLHLTQQVVS